MNLCDVGIGLLGAIGFVATVFIVVFIFYAIGGAIQWLWMKLRGMK